MLGLKDWLLKEYDKAYRALKYPFRHPNALLDYQVHAFITDAFDEMLILATYCTIIYLATRNSVPLSALTLVQKSNEELTNQLTVFTQRVQSAFYEWSVLALHCDLTMLQAQDSQDVIMPAPKGPWTLEARGVSWYYRGAFRLSDVNFTVQSGQICGIYGANGSGKSFLTQILSGLYVPTTGNIFINKVDMRNINQNDLTQNIAVLWQDTGQSASLVLI